MLLIGVGNGGQGAFAAKIREKVITGKCHVKFGYFVNFSCIIFSGKMPCCQSSLNFCAYDVTGCCSDINLNRIFLIK